MRGLGFELCNLEFTAIRQDDWVQPDAPAPRYWGAFNVVGPSGRLVDLAACDAEGRTVEMATDVVLEQDGWRVFWSRAVESGLEVDDEIRLRAANALFDARERRRQRDGSVGFGLVQSDTLSDSVRDWPDSPVTSFLEDRLRGGLRDRSRVRRLLGTRWRRGRRRGIR